MRVVLILLVACLVVSLLLLLRTGSVVEPIAVAPRSSSQPDPRVAPQLASAGDEVRTVPDPSVSPAVEFLATYWGDQWPSVKAVLDAAGVNYADRAAITVPWEAAALEIEKRLPFTEDEKLQYKQSFTRWKGQVDREFLLSRFGNCPPLDEAAWTQLRSIADEHLAEVDRFATELVNGLEAEVLAAWHGGRFIRAPYNPTGAPGFGGECLFSRGDGYEGWTASVCLNWKDMPRLLPIREDLDARLRVLDQAIQAWLSEWRTTNRDKHATSK